jgi:hypothetical protein
MSRKKIYNDASEKDQLIVTGGYGEVQVHRTLFPNARGDLAIKMAERLAICTGYATGTEDSSGRMIQDLLPPEDVASRACKIADYLITEIEDREWFVEVPIKQIVEDDQKEGR